jgi:hypothetical protein
MLQNDKGYIEKRSYRDGRVRELAPAQATDENTKAMTEAKFDNDETSRPS